MPRTSRDDRQVEERLEGWRGTRPRWLRTPAGQVLPSPSRRGWPAPTAQLTGWPPKVMPWRNERSSSRNGSASVADEHAAERRVAGRHALGEGDHVGLVAEPVGAEPGAEAAERADHLVGHEQHAVAVADLPHPLEVAGRRGRSNRRRSAPARGTRRRRSRVPPRRSGARCRRRRPSVHVGRRGAELAVEAVGGGRVAGRAVEQRAGTAP